VRQSIVVARPAADGDLRLVAYLVPEDVPPAIDDLRGFLAHKLPPYMIPADFVVLEAFPLSPTGKVDRKALPEPETAATLEREFALPETPTEELLLTLWQEILGRARIGIHDNFFELGGHSLLMPKMVSRIETAFGLNLSLRDFFQAPTIAGMAIQVDLLLLQEIEALEEEEAESLAQGGAEPALRVEEPSLPVPRS
jgi:hypothetical protein